MLNQKRKGGRKGNFCDHSSWEKWDKKGRWVILALPSLSSFLFPEKRRDFLSVFSCSSSSAHAFPHSHLSVFVKVHDLKNKAKASNISAATTEHSPNGFSNHLIKNSPESRPLAIPPCGTRNRSGRTFEKKIFELGRSTFYGYLFFCLITCCVSQR